MPNSFLILLLFSRICDRFQPLPILPKIDINLRKTQVTLLDMVVMKDGGSFLHSG